MKFLLPISVCLLLVGISGLITMFAHNRSQMESVFHIQIPEPQPDPNGGLRIPDL